MKILHEQKESNINFMIDADRFRREPLVVTKPFREMDKVEAKAYLEWYQYAVGTVAPVLIEEGLGVKAGKENLPVICDLLEELLIAETRIVRLPEKIIEERKKELGEKWAFLVDGTDLSADTIYLALGASLIVAWACLQEVPELPWKFPTAKSDISYNMPVLSVHTSWARINPLHVCIDFCYGVGENDYKRGRIKWFVKERTHEVYDVINQMKKE